MSKTSDLGITIREVDKFIKQLHDGDIAIDKEAQAFHMSSPTINPMSILKEDMGSLADVLGSTIARYLTYKDIKDPSQSIVATELLSYIERARTHGFIIHQNLAKELTNFKLENARLNEENEKLRKENARLNQLNEALNQTINRLMPRNEDERL